MAGGAARAATAHAATKAWVAHFVCGLGLCPWASLAETLVVVAPCITRDAEAVGVRFMQRQAELLARGARPHRGARRSTVVSAFTHEAYRDVGEFARLWRSVEFDLAAFAPDELVLLAFHPDRVDSGPGCVPADAMDAGHFSVRSPLPTLQLLRATDVDVAREDWAKAHGGRGAFKLLESNKRKLRSIGAVALRSRIDACWYEQASTATVEGDPAPP